MKPPNAPNSPPDSPSKALTRRGMLLGTATAVAALAPLPGSYAHAQLVFDATSKTLESGSGEPLESRFRISNPSPHAVTLISIKPLTPGTRARFSAGSKTIRPGESRDVLVTTPPHSGRNPQEHRVEVRTDQRFNPTTTLTVTVAQPGSLEREQRREAARAKREALMAGLTLTPDRLVWAKGEAASMKTVVIEAKPGHYPSLALETWAIPEAVRQARAERLAKRPQPQKPNNAEPTQAPRRPMGFARLNDPDAFSLQLTPASLQSGNRRWTLRVTPESTDQPGPAMIRLAAFPNGLPTTSGPATQPIAEPNARPARYRDAVPLVIPARITPPDRRHRSNASPATQPGK